jgi:hypothetical protein
VDLQASSPLKYCKNTDITKSPGIFPGDFVSSKEAPMFEIVILILFVYWLFSLFGHAIPARLPRPDSFIYMLSLVIFALISLKFIALFYFPVL